MTNFMSPKQKHRQRESFPRLSRDDTYLVIYDDFLVIPSRSRETSVQYLWEKRVGMSVIGQWRSAYEIETISLVLLPFLTIRWWSGEPVHEYLEVTTSRLVSTSGPTWTKGQQRKNCLKPRRNLKRRPEKRSDWKLPPINPESKKRYCAVGTSDNRISFTFNFNAFKHPTKNYVTLEAKSETKTEEILSLWSCLKFTKSEGWPNKKQWTSINFFLSSWGCIINVTN